MIAYGTECLWWDEAINASIQHTLEGVKLRCPYCAGKCELHHSRESFLHMAHRFELIGFAGHHDMIVWSQGKCFKTRKDAWLAYRLASLRQPTMA